MTQSAVLYRHDEIQIHRPYAFDVDGNDWLWEGTSGNRLLGHNLRTAELKVIRVPEMSGHVAYSVFCCQGVLVIVLGDCPFYLVYDVATNRCQKRPLPGAKPIVWYGLKLPGDKLLLCDRGGRQALFLDEPLGPLTAVACPFAGDFPGGNLASDGLIYIFSGDPARLIRLDPAARKFVDETPLPWPETGVSGRFEHNGVLYCADSAGGRLLPLNLATQRWGQPISHPDHGKVFGFIGASFSMGSTGYFCLSTYTARSRLDTATGRVIVPQGVPLSVDGRFYRFMEKMLTFNAQTQSFDYATAPPQPDGVPLLCYSWTDGTRFAVSGIVLPFDEPGQAGREPGAWLIWQNPLADLEPGLGPFRFDFDREAHLARWRRAYPARHSLFLPSPPHTPTIVDLRGPALQYPAGTLAKLERRAKRTDAEAYWKQVAHGLFPEETPTAQKVQRILEHVNRQIYYNPIQEPEFSSPIVAHESHDGRCGITAELIIALCQAAGVEVRQRGLKAHVIAETFYDDSWHCADALFFGTQQPAREGRVLSVDELKADPLFADAFPQECFAYDPELLMSQDGYQVLGYVFGPWGSEPYYSYYLGAAKEHPPSLPTIQPLRRLGGDRLRLSWSPANHVGGGEIEYAVRLCSDRAGKDAVLSWRTGDTQIDFTVPEGNRMYYVQLQAMDDHRLKNPQTWYATAKWNFVLSPPKQYGWYGVL